MVALNQDFPIMSFVDTFRSLSVSSIRTMICPLLDESDYASLVSWHAQSACLADGKAHPIMQWDFNKRHQATKASYILWLLFNMPTDDLMSYIMTITSILETSRKSVFP